jgi:hypothetical protein
MRFSILRRKALKIENSFQVSQPQETTVEYKYQNKEFLHLADLLPRSEFLDTLSRYTSIDWKTLGVESIKANKLWITEFIMEQNNENLFLEYFYQYFLDEKDFCSLVLLLDHDSGKFILPQYHEFWTQALFLTVKEGSLDFLATLLEKNSYSNIDENDETGKSALFWACELGHYSIALELFRLGANVYLDQGNGKCPQDWIKKNEWEDFSEKVKD